MIKYLTIVIAFTTLRPNVMAQSGTGTMPAKVSHAEPIYFDLIRDLGARKGEREWNVGMGMTSARTYTAHTWLVEYEFAPLNRLGMEVELPLAFYRPVNIENKGGIHEHNGLEGVKAAMQYSFFVSEKRQATLAVGYIFEWRQKGLHHLGSFHHPFLIAAKKWGRQFHSLIYAGPSFERDVERAKEKTGVLVNANIHYVLPGTKNFIGIETNEEIDKGHFETIIRPQVKMTLSSAASLGLAMGIPAGGQEKYLDFLLRCIYEPGKK